MKTKFVSACVMGLTVLTGAVLAGESEPTPSEAQVAKVAPIRGMDKVPEIVTRVAPVYPTELRERGIQGVATVEMLIDSTGRVIEAKAVRSTNRQFAAQAEAAASQWVFRPAEADGKKITSRVMVPFEFSMPQIAALENR